MKKKGSPSDKKRPGKLDAALNIGAAVSAVGLLSIYLFVSPEKVEGRSFFHILQMSFILLAVVSAVGIAYTALKAIEKKKAEKKT